jgi:hypothetical protein
MEDKKNQQGFNTTSISLWISSADTVPAGDLIAPPLLAFMRARRSL